MKEFLFGCAYYDEQLKEILTLALDNWDYLSK